MLPPDADAVVVRWGELYTKSDPVRQRMTRRLADNLRAVLADRDLPGSVAARSGRLLVETGQPDPVADAASEVPGVVSASPAAVVEPTRDAIRDALAAAASEHYDGGTFAVDANRAYGGLPFTSEDVGRFGGDAVYEAAEARGHDPEVDLDDPDLTFGVDCRRERAYVFLERREGPGGLPVGSQAPLVALVSGGIDSPVAAFEAMRRGSPVVPVYLDLGEFGGPDHRARAEASMATLAARAPDHVTEGLVVPAGDTVEHLAASVDQGRMLAFRRFCLLVAAAVAAERGCAGIVTGEALGQKSSQTAANLRVTDAAVELPVHRPLLTVDKPDITERARALGTFDDATVPVGCQAFAPDQPATAATVERVEELEPGDLAERAQAAAADAEGLVLGQETRRDSARSRSGS